MSQEIIIIDSPVGKVTQQRQETLIPTCTFAKIQTELKLKPQNKKFDLLSSAYFGYSRVARLIRPQHPSHQRSNNDLVQRCANQPITTLLPPARLAPLPQELQHCPRLHRRGQPDKSECPRDTRIIIEPCLPKSCQHEV